MRAARKAPALAAQAILALIRAETEDDTEEDFIDRHVAAELIAIALAELSAIRRAWTKKD